MLTASPATRPRRTFTSDFEFAARRVHQLRRYRQDKWQVLNTVAAHYRIKWQALRDYLGNW